MHFRFRELVKDFYELFVARSDMHVGGKGVGVSNSSETKEHQMANANEKNSSSSSKKEVNPS